MCVLGMCVNGASPVRCALFLCYLCASEMYQLCVVCVVASNGCLVFLDRLVKHVTSPCE